MPQKANSAYYWQGQDLIINIYVQTRASKDEIVGLHEQSLKVRIRAAPVNGKANDFLIRFLAKQFGVSKSELEILSGQQSRWKRLRIKAPHKLPVFIHAPDLTKDLKP